MTNDNEWYTPSCYIEAARVVMGSIDLDPASCEEANRTVKATHYYTKEDNGLIQPWHGNVWCNPPYGRSKGGGNHLSYQKAFAEKLLREYTKGHITQALLLSLGNPNSLWFQPFYDYPVCHLRGQIHFTRINGEIGKFGFPLAFIYLGPYEARFIEVFQQFGRIVRAIDAPQQHYTYTQELWSVANDRTNCYNR